MCGRFLVPTISMGAQTLFFRVPTLCFFGARQMFFNLRLIWVGFVRGYWWTTSGSQWK